MELEKKLNILNQFNTNELTTYLRNERQVAFIVWQTDDVIRQANEYGFEMSQKDAERIIGDIDRSSDCDFGITWETIRSHIDYWVENNSFEVVIKEESNGEERTTNFCSLVTNENIEEYWNDDDYYFYGLSKEEVRSFIGKGEMVGEAIIVSV